MRYRRHLDHLPRSALLLPDGCAAVPVRTSRRSRGRVLIYRPDATGWRVTGSPVSQGATP